MKEQHWWQKCHFVHLNLRYFWIEFCSFQLSTFGNVPNISGKQMKTLLNPKHTFTILVKFNNKTHFILIQCVWLRNKNQLSFSTLIHTQTHLTDSNCIVISGTWQLTLFPIDKHQTNYGFVYITIISWHDVQCLIEMASFIFSLALEVIAFWGWIGFQVMCLMPKFFDFRLLINNALLNVVRFYYRCMNFEHKSSPMRQS